MDGATLLDALRGLADAAEAQMRSDTDATPAHLRCIESGYLVMQVIEARAALARAEGRS